MTKKRVLLGLYLVMASLVLPSTLSREYEIQIIQGNICFYGYIEL